MELREIYDFNQKCIEESADKKTVRYKAPFMTPGKVNANFRLYPLPVLNQAVEEFSRKIEKGKGWGGSYHPESGKLEIDTVSHTIKKMYLRNGIAYVEGEILDNEKGKKILSLIKAGSTLGLSARSFGTMKQEKGVSTIQPGLKIMGIDFVLNPSEDVAKVDQSNIFESAEIVEKPKNEVSLVEFNFLVEKLLDDSFDDQPRDKWEEFAEKNWTEFAGRIEEALKKSGKTVEEPVKNIKVELEDFPISEEHYLLAQLSGYSGTLNEFLETREKQNDPLLAEFREAQISGFEGTFDDFKKVSQKE